MIIMIVRRFLVLIFCIGIMCSFLANQQLNRYPVSANQIFLRFYYLQRLSKPVHMLYKYYKRHSFCALHTFVEKGHKFVIDDKLQFNNERVKLCIKRMEETQCLDQLFRLWLELKQYKLLGNDTFVREFSILTFITYKNIITHCLTKQPNLHKSLGQSILNLYNNLESLPLEEILEAIDMLSEELPPILEQYQINSDMTLGEWFKKYWWIPPLVIVTLSVQILLIFQKGKINKIQQLAKAQAAGYIMGHTISRIL